MDRMDRRSFLKRAFATGALLAGGGLFGVGCGSSGATARRTLDFWAFSDTRTWWQQKAWDMYRQAKKPDFNLNFILLPYQQMHDKVMVATQAGSGGPDIADIEIGSFARFIKGKPIFVDLKPHLEKRGLMDKYYRASAMDPWSWQGHVYGIGSELNACLLSYRWDILEKAGVKMPIDNWDDFTREAEKYHKETGNSLIDFPTQDSGSWWQMTLQQGKTYFGPSGNLTLTSKESVRTLEYQKKALSDGWSIHRPLGQAYDTALSTGKIASLLGPAWNFSGFVQQSLPDTKGKWRLQPIPEWPGGSARTATQGGTGVSVLNTSGDIESAVDFVLWEHSSVDALIGDFKHRQTWPTYKPAFRDPSLTQPIPFFDNQRVGNLIEQVADKIPTWYTSPFWPETNDAFVRIALTPGLTSDISAISALKAAQKEAQSIIQFETA